MKKDSNEIYVNPIKQITEINNIIRETCKVNPRTGKSIEPRNDPAYNFIKCEEKD